MPAVDLHDSGTAASSRSRATLTATDEAGPSDAFENQRAATPDSSRTDAQTLTELLPPRGDSESTLNFPSSSPGHGIPRVDSPIPPSAWLTRPRQRRQGMIALPSSITGLLRRLKPSRTSAADALELQTLVQFHGQATSTQTQSVSIVGESSSRDVSETLYLPQESSRTDIHAPMGLMSARDDILSPIFGTSEGGTTRVDTLMPAGIEEPVLMDDLEILASVAGGHGRFNGVAGRVRGFIRTHARWPWWGRR